jgi:peptidyl-prolyl cis-trans isomerase C
MTRLLTPAVVIALLALSASVPALAATEEVDKSIATVNGKAIPKSRADAMVAMQIAQGRSDSEQLRNAAKDELVNREVLEQEARNQGFGKKPEVKIQMELARQSALINAFMQDYLLSHPISEDTLKKEYEMVKTQASNKEYKARHILVENEDTAKDIIARLNKGEKFEELAKQSKDAGSRDRGGDLGWALPANFVHPFAEAMITLEKGKYTEIPVKTDYGYHVIMLDDSRVQNVPSFEAAKPQLSKRLQAQLVAKRVAELRGKARIE